MAEYKFIESPIKGLYVVEPQVFGDSRGYFMEAYTKKNFVAAGLDMEFVQDNESRSKKGVLRGLHFQTKYSQGKLVRALQGKVFDVGVDLRKDSPTFGKWFGEVLSEENKKMLYIPEGFAHGFLVLSDTATFTYKCTNYYAPEYDAGIMFDDPDIGIQWPMEGLGEVLLSEKDKKHPSFKEFCKNNPF